MSSPKIVEVIEIAPPLGFTPSVLQPRARRMRELREQCDYPHFIHLKAPPPTVNVRTGEGLEYKEIYFSTFHLQALDLSLHPLVHYFLY